MTNDFLPKGQETNQLLVSGFIRLEEQPDETIRLIVNPHEKQKQILEANERVLCYFAGSGSGKSRLAAVWLLRQIERFPQGDFICMAPTYDMANRVLVTAVKELLDLTQYKCRYSTTEKMMRLPTGGRIYFGSMEAPTGIEGIHAVCFIFDECAAKPTGSAGYALARKRTNLWASHYEKGKTKYPAGQILLTTTQYANDFGFDWVNELIQQYEDGSDELFVVTGDSTDNPGYSKTVLDSAKDNLSEQRYKIEYTGNFNTNKSGLVYPNFESCFVERVPDYVWQHCKLFGGIDWGSEGATQGDPFACVIGALDPSERLWIFYERYVVREILEKHCEELLKVQEQLLNMTGKRVLFAADPSRPEHIRRFRLSGVNIRKAITARGSVAQGIELIRNRIGMKNLQIVNSRCQGLVYESTRYKYKVDAATETAFGKPRSRHDHAMDALRYIVLQIDRRIKHGRGIDTDNEIEEIEE